MNEKEETKRQRGQHLKKNEAKVEILKFILDNDSPVLEPDIREHLKKTFGTNDSKTMKVHFQNLQKLQCIKKIANSGKENEWKIDSVKHLKNINESFKEIELNRFKKAVEIIVDKFTDLEKITIGDFILKKIDMSEFTPDDIPSKSTYWVDLMGGTFRAYLKMSLTFFEMCMSTDIETLYDRWLSLCKISNDINAYVLMELTFRDAYDFYIRELPYLAFKNCIFMDVLSGKDSSMLQQAKDYISIKDLYTKQWDPYSVEDNPELLMEGPPTILHKNYAEFSDIADSNIRDLMKK